MPLISSSLHRRLPGLLAGAALAFAGAVPAAHAQMPAAADLLDPDLSIYTVTSTHDAADAAVGDGTCATSGGKCTLRAALQEANNDRERSEIRFGFGDHTQVTISVSSALPALWDFAGPTVIDGGGSANGQSTRAKIAIKGPGASSGVDGLTITSTGNEVIGLALYNFRNPIRITGWNNRVSRMVLGTDWNGKWSDPVDPAGIADRAGVVLESDAANNLIGGSADRANYMAGNPHGVILRGTASANTVGANHIGIAPTGAAIGNAGHGVILGPQTRFNSIVDSNVIGANRHNGVVVGGLLNRVQGNLLGLRRIPREYFGELLVPNGAANVVVGPSVHARIGHNHIAGSKGGVLVAGTDISGTVVAGNVIGGQHLSNPSDPAAVGVDVRDGQYLAVKDNAISYQHIGVRVRRLSRADAATPVLLSGNTFASNGTNVVAP